MPVLRYRTADGEWVEIALHARMGGAQGLAKTTILTLGSAPPSENHIHLSGRDVQAIHAKILGSRASVAYAFVLSGSAVQFRQRPLEGIRVLRHGDIVGVGNVELHYLDFVLYRLQDSSLLLGKQCDLPSCDRGKILSVGHDVIACPWCGRAYHETCWLKLEQCATLGCYPVRRMLLGELEGQVRSEKLTASPQLSTMQCSSECGVLLRADEEVVRCSGPGCNATYHVGCWLAMRGDCPQCGFEIVALIDRLVFHNTGGKTE